MIAQRIIAACLILLQCYLLSTLAPASSFVLVVSIASMLAIWFSIPIPVWLYFLLSTSATIYFFTTTLWSPPEFVNDWLLPGKYVYAFSKSLISIQWLEFARTKLSLRIQPRFSVMVLFAFLVGFCRLETSQNSLEFFLVAVGMAVLFALLAQSNFRSQEQQLTRYTKNSPFRTAVFVAAAVSIVLATGYLANTAKSATELLRIFAGQAASDFSTATTTKIAYNPSGKLDSITKLKSKEPETIMLETTCDVQPGYLRGRIFSGYDNNQWQNNPRPKRRLTALNEFESDRIFTNAGIGKRIRDEMELFSLSGQRDGPFRQIVTQNTESLVGKFFFTHHESDLLLGKSRNLLLDDNQVVRDGWSVKTSYTALTSAKEIKILLSPINKRQLLEVSSGTRRRLGSLAREIASDASTDAEIMSAIEKFFAQEFTYSLESPAKQSDDFVSEFILERQPGHCEFFATGAAMLLRLNGIPCRYVTGYLMVEESENETNIGDMWVAKNKHAHAWVEAYDRDQQRWRIVEATPGTDAPKTLWPDRESASDPAATRIESVDDELTDNSSWSFRQILFYAQRFISELGNRLTSTANLILALALPILVFIYYRQRRLRFQVGEYSQPRFGKKLKNLDKRLRKLDLVRAPAETLHQFANRLKSYRGDQQDWVHASAQQYLDYALHVYGGQGVAKN